MMHPILIVFAHPAYERSKINKSLIERTKQLDNVVISDLYELYPDFEIDIAAEQQKLRDADIVVFQHPFYWYSCPALMKEWVDLVLQHGFAYGKGGSALHGKWLLTATTAGGKLEAYDSNGYNGHTVRELLLPFERTAALCGMKYLPPFVEHNSHKLSADEIAQHSEDYATLLRSLREERLSFSKACQVTELNELVSDLQQTQPKPPSDAPSSDNDTAEEQPHV